MLPSSLSLCYFFFFFNDTATTEIYTLSLHDALPISELRRKRGRGRIRFELCGPVPAAEVRQVDRALRVETDRKSTRLNSSHLVISYAVFCLKKKKKKKQNRCHQRQYVRSTAKI